MLIAVVELCGKPEGKGRPRFSRSARIAFTPANTRKYEANLKFAAQEAMAGQPPFDGPVSVLVEALFPIPQSWSKKKQAQALTDEIRHTSRPDVDNLMKSIDALNQVVFRDDSQIVHAVVTKRYSDRPALRITVRAVP
jgi:Holliday junction resolvase RusA-like endonuclease